MVKEAYYIADKGTIFDKIIDRWTGGYGYSHVEIIFSDGVAFSASPREGKCRFKKINFNSGKWVVKEFPEITPDQERVMRMKAEAINGLKYDYIGVIIHQGIFGGLYRLLQIGIEKLPDWLQINEQWWCSEAVSWIRGEDEFRIDPNILAVLRGVPSPWSYNGGELV